MNKKVGKMTISMALAAALAFTPAQAFAAANDISGHWAEEVIAQWQDKGLISGYEDGSFRPDNQVTRAEFVIMLNKVLGFTQKGTVSFSDVDADAWYHDAVAIAVEAGYCSGYEDGTFKPNTTITRAEAAVMIARAKGLTANEEAADRFADVSNIPVWAKGSIGAVTASGFMSGRPDGTFDAVNTITRAEAVSSLNRVMEKEKDTEEKDDVIVTKDDAVIENQTIEGNLVIDEAVGEGEVYVNNTTVKGDVIIKGGGDDSIYFDNVTVKGKVKVQKENVRVQVKGDTKFSEIEVKEACNIVAKDFEGTVDVISITNEIDSSDKVTIAVPANEVIVNAKASVLVKEDVKELKISKDAASSKVEIAKDCTVKTVVADAKVSITGSGKIEKLEANADNITISSSTDVKDTEVAEGVEKPSTSTGGSGGGGSSSGGSSVSVADKLLMATSNAINYKYDDYTYTSALTHSKDGKNAVVMGEYTEAEVLSGAAMNDMARYLGALHRVDGGTTVKSIAYQGVEYTWSEKHELMGSNWVQNPENSETKGNTLVSVIVQDFQDGKIQDAIQLPLKGSNGSTITLSYGFKLEDVNNETTATVNNIEEFNAALTDEKIQTININGTIGDESTYSVFDVKHPVTIKGGTVYGSFVVTADGTVFDGVRIINKGDVSGENTAVRNGINAACHTLTVRNCTFEMKQSTNGISNGLSIWPTQEDVNYTITGNTFNGFSQSDNGYASTAITISGGIQKDFTGIQTKSVLADMTDEEDFAIITGNTFENCKSDYTREDWTSGNVVYSRAVSNGSNLLLDNAASTAKYYITGAVSRSSDATVKEGTTLTITEKGSLTMKEGTTFTVNGTLVNNGVLDVYNSNLSGTGKIVVADGGMLNMNANYNGGTGSMLPTIEAIEVQNGGTLQSMTTNGEIESTIFVGKSEDARIQTNDATVTFGFTGEHPTMEIVGDAAIPAGQTWYTMFDSSTEAIGIEMMLNGTLTVDGTLKVVSANSTGSELVVDSKSHLIVNGTITTATKGKITGTDATSVITIAETANVENASAFEANHTYTWKDGVWTKASAESGVFAAEEAIEIAEPVVEQEMITTEPTTVVEVSAEEAVVIEAEQVNPEEIIVLTAE